MRSFRAHTWAVISGSMAKSSWVSASERSTSARIAAPLPRFGWWMTTRPAPPAAQRSSSSPVPSQEPSSTTTTCFSSGSASTRSRTSPIVLVGALVAGLTIYLNVKSHSYGFDFRGGEWVAGRDVLAGRSPYPAPDPAHLVAVGNAYIPPPLLAVLSVPLSLLPMVPAAIVLDVVSTAALALALRIVGVRDWRGYRLPPPSFPRGSPIVLRPPDGLPAPR